MFTDFVRTGDGTSPPTKTCGAKRLFLQNFNIFILVTVSVAKKYTFVN